MVTSTFPFQFSQLTKRSIRIGVPYKALLGSQDVWEIVDRDYEKPREEATLTPIQRETPQNMQKKDQQVLTLIH